MWTKWKVFRVLCFLKKNLRFAINDHRALGQLHHRTLQHHNDLLDGGLAASTLSSQLDVEVIVTAPACRGQNVVAGGIQLKNIPIKGLEVVVAPCTTDLVVVDGIHTYKERLGFDTATFYISFFFYPHTVNKCSFLPTNWRHFTGTTKSTMLTCYFFGNWGHVGEHAHSRLCICRKKARVMYQVTNNQ